MRLEGNANTWDRWTHMVPCDAVAFRYSVMELESASSKADDSDTTANETLLLGAGKRPILAPSSHFSDLRKRNQHLGDCTVRAACLASLVCGVSALSPHDRLTTHCTPY